MASLQELADLQTFDATKYSNLVDKIAEAAKIKAVALLGGTPTAAQITWVNDLLANPGAKATELVHYVIGANESATQTNILDAGDAAIQANVDTAVDALAV